MMRGPRDEKAIWEAGGWKLVEQIQRLLRRGVALKFDARSIGMKADARALRITL
jgi:hypothetical protein